MESRYRVGFGNRSFFKMIWYPQLYNYLPGSSKDETREETSKRLRNVKSILAKFGSDPTYKVKSKGSKYYGCNVEELEAGAFKLETIKAHQEHAEKLLKRKQPLLTQLQEKKAKLKPPTKQEKREIS